MRLLCAFLLTLLALPAAEPLYDQKNLAAWCIVPFDNQKRTPEQRATMVAKMGLTKVAYDWRSEHVAEFEQEILAYQKNGIEYFAFWAQHDEAFRLFEKYQLHPQIWVIAGVKGDTQEAKVKNAAEGLLPTIAKTAKIGSKLAIYNHGGWSGEPENMVAICEYLKKNHGVTNVGIVYNLHHGHSHLARLDEALKLMLPHLLCLNINGMDIEGDAKGRKILPVGAGTQDLKVLRQVRASGYAGVIGILNHTMEDAEGRLLDNLDGLKWLVPQLDDAPTGPKPKYRTWSDKSVMKKTAIPSGRPAGVPSVSSEFGKALAGGWVVDGGAQFEQWPLTIECLAKLNSKSGFNILVSNNEKSASTHWEVYSYVKTGYLSIYLPGFGGEYRSETDICDGKWHDILASVSAEKVRLWVDGKMVLERATAPAGPLRPPQQHKLGFGQLIDASVGCDGIIDDVRISRGANDPTTWIKGPRKRMDISLGLWNFDDIDQITARRAGPAPAPFTPGLAPLRREDNIIADQFVNRDRVFDYYAKEAMEFMGHQPAPVMLPSYPGLDGGSQGHWGNQNDAVTWKDGRWDKADHGVLFSGVFRGAGLTIPKAVCVRKGTEAACFDPLTLSFPVRWTGDFIKLGDGRHGFGGGANMAGKLSLKTLAEKPKGDWKYHGFYRHGERTIFAYNKGGSEYLADAWEGEQPAEKLAAFTKGGPAQWPAWLETTGKLGTQQPFATDTVLPPFKNPYGTLFFITGIDFFKDGTAAVCTMTGEVWLVKGLDAQFDHVRWKRFATGLHHALGVKIIDDKLYVLGRDQITRLHDLNGDGEADFYECVNNAMTTSPGGHDFIVGLDADAQGRFYTSSGNQGVLRLSDSNKVEVLATGLRNPNGITVTPDGKFILSNVQEGNWTPASAVCQVEVGRNEGTHFGSGGLKPSGMNTLPILQLPRGEDNSCGGQIFLSESGWSGLKGDGNFLHFSFGTGSAWLVSRQLLEGVWQSAAVKITGNFMTGPQHGRFGPHDGHLYVSGMVGWGSYTPEDGALHRVRHTGGEYPTLIGHEARDNGVLLRFNRVVDASFAAKASSHFAQCWNYLFGPAYGSPEYSVKYPDSIGHDPLEIRSAHVVEQGRAIFLEIPQLTPANQIHLHVGVMPVRSQDVFLTAHHLGKPYTDYPGYVAVPKVMGHDHVAPVATGKVNPVKWEIEMCRGPVREMKLQAATGLQYLQKELRAKAGEGIALQFDNPDIMPHNFVLVAPGAVDRVGELSAKMVAMPDGYARHYVPESPEVLCYSRMLDPGKQATVYFNAPKEPGRYPYFCSFPGHSQMMRGVLIVE